MANCLHGGFYWRTDKAGKRFRYCRICHAVVHPPKKKRPAPDGHKFTCPSCGEFNIIYDVEKLRGGRFKLICPECSHTCYMMERYSWS